MTIKQQIISYIQNLPKGIDDDELAKALGLSTRQQANQNCRDLEKVGFIKRYKVNGKIHNFWTGKSFSCLSNSQSVSENIQKQNHWFWEGNVQSKTINYLVKEKYLIRSVANTASRQRGIDIIAEKDGKLLWVSVKGYPVETNKTKPSVQAGHWFKQAIFDIIEYREREQNVKLAIALPNFPRYRSLAQKITWFKPVANYSFIWVEENGDVSVE